MFSKFFRFSLILLFISSLAIAGGQIIGCGGDTNDLLGDVDGEFQEALDGDFEGGLDEGLEGGPEEGFEDFEGDIP